MDRSTTHDGLYVVQANLSASKASQYVQTIMHDTVTLDAAGVCTDARVALGAIAPTALLVPDAAAALVGHKLDEPTLAALDAAARRICKPIDDKRGTIDYRTKVAGVLARRAAAIAFERAAGRVAGVH